MVNFVQKIDSNITGLRYCEELRNTKIGTLPAASAQIWYPVEPNSYNDFGAKTKTVARMPINPSRQLRKGTLVDLDPALGFQNDLTQDGMTRLLQGFFFANLRESFDTNSYNNPDTTISSVVSPSTFKLSYGDQLANVAANDLLFSSGFAASANNGLFEVASTASAKATGTLTGTSTAFVSGDTITIGTRVYTFRTTVSADGDVKVAGSYAASFTNLQNAINNSGGVPGTDYFVLAADPNVTAVAVSLVLTATALRYGYAPNAVVTTKGGGNTGDATWGSGTLTGGTANIVVTATSLVNDASPAAGSRLEVVGYQFSTGDLTVTNDGTDLPSLGTTTKDLTTLPLIPGQWVWIGGDSSTFQFATAADNGWARLRTITTHQAVLDKTSNETVTDTGSAKTIQIFWGKVLQNEAVPTLQVRRTYTFERTLGYPDLNNPTAPQAEYVEGAVPNEITFNVPTAEKITLDLTYMGVNYYTIDQTGTILSNGVGASAPSIAFEDAFNTSSEVTRARMTIIPDTSLQGDASTNSLFAELTEFKFMVKNNLKPNKAVGYLGPFEMTAGFFEGSGSVQAYFDTVASVQAVRDNADVSIDFFVAHNNKGVSVDLPLLTLSSKGLDVKINEPILLPIEMTMGADRNFNTTLHMEFYDYLPTLAMPVG